jgi:hypothetical protein
MTLAEPLVAALRVCPTGPQAEEIVPMPVLMSYLIHKMWDPVVVSRRYRFAYPTPVHPAAGIADRVVLVPRDLVLLVTPAGFPTPVVVAQAAVNPACPMPAVAVAGSWSPVFPNLLPAAVNPAYPMLAAVVAGSWSLVCPMLVAVAQAAVSPACPNRLPAAAHSGPRRRAAASLAYPMYQLVALAAPKDYRSPAPVDSSRLARPVVPGVANQ